MEIIDNFGLQFRHDGQSFAWMSDVVRQINKSSSSGTIVRLYGERKLDHIEFELSNGQNKSQVRIIGQKGRAKALLFQRAAPDPVVGFRPAMVREGTVDVVLNWAGLQTLSETVRNHLEKDTVYSLGTVVKIKVTPTAKPVEPWSFAGGQITHLEEADDAFHLTVEGGKYVYTIPKARMYGRKLASFKYVLFNENGDFDFVGSNEFNFYFEMKHVEHS